MSFPGIPSLDAAVMAFIQTHFHNTVTDTVFPIITSLGEAGIGWIVLSLVLLCFKKNAPHRWFGAYRHDGHAAFRRADAEKHHLPPTPVQRVHGFPDAHRAPHVLFVPLGPHIVKLCRSAYFDAPPQKSRLARVHSGSAHRVLPHFPFCPLPYRCPRRHPSRHSRRPPHLLCRQGDSKTTGREAHGTNLNRLFRQIKAARRFHSLRAFSISVQFFLVHSSNTFRTLCAASS